MFRCIVPGTTDPNNENWVDATYISKKLENGFNKGIRDTPRLVWMIKPFTEGLFQATFDQDRRIRDYALKFIIEIRTGGETVYAGEFYYRSDRNPFEPTMEDIMANPDIPPYLVHLYEILVTTKFLHISDIEPSSPKPIKKTFKQDQCVICLDRKPNVLFVKCRHTCVCEECEEAHPSTNCPCCRTEISEKLLI